jgi:hypothetical protein
MMVQQRGAVLASLAALLAACGGVPVNVRTPDPLTVDVTLRVDIYKRTTEAATDAAAAAPTADTGTSDEETRRRARMAQIQSMKNSRLVGEDRTGRLSILHLPAGAYGQTVEQTVAAENVDRTALMRAEAAQRRVPLAVVEREQAAEWRRRAFAGEWIEEQQPDGTWRWLQKAPEQQAPATLEPPPAP